MSKNKIQKLISVMLMLALAAQWIPCGAANIVPIRGGNMAVPPSSPVTKTNTDFKNPGGVFSLQSMKSKIDEVIYPQKSKAEPREENPSGTCGDNCSWSLNTETGEITISGTGEMDDWDYYGVAPWVDNRNSIKSVIINDGITSIGGNAFLGCNALESVTLGNNVTSIGGGAFSGCNKLTSVSLDSNDAVSCFKSVFSESPITSITLGNNVTSIKERAFQGCSSLTSINIPDSVTSIGWYAFQDCSHLTSIDIPDSITSIGWYAFERCYALTNVTIGNSVTSIKNYAFDSCSNLLSINIPDSVTSIGNSAFYGCSSLANVTVGNSVTSIGSKAFACCNGLHSITIPYSVISIGNEAFTCCSNLLSINIPDSVTSIGEEAFSACWSLTNVIIGNSVTSIGNETFFDCKKLSHVCYLGSSDPGKSSGGVFKGCGELANVSVTENYNSTTFCGKQACDDGTCLAESSSTQSSKTPDDKKYIVKIELDEGVKVNKKDVNEFIQIICETSEISKDNISVEVKTDAENNVLSILVYVNDEETANTIVAKINEEKQKC